MQCQAVSTTLGAIRVPVQLSGSSMGTNVRRPITAVSLSSSSPPLMAFQETPTCAAGGSPTPPQLTTDKRPQRSAPALAPPDILTSKPMVYPRPGLRQT